MLNKIRDYLIKKQKEIDKLIRIFKIWYLISFFLFIFFAIFSPYIEWKIVSSNIEDIVNVNSIKEKYKKQIYVGDFKDYYNNNKNKIVKVLHPKSDWINFFQLVEYDKNKNIVLYKDVYKLINEEWSDYKSINELKWFKYKSWLWLHSEIIWNSLAKHFDSLISFIFIWFLVYLFTKMSWFWWKLPLSLFKAPKDEWSFDYIGGIETQKEELIEIVDTLKEFGKFKVRWVRPMRWILFNGPPWVGKTLIARTIAANLWVDIFVASWTDFWSKYINEWPQKVNRSFEHIEKFIKKHQKEYAILFVDELDSILSWRWQWHSEDDKVVNSFLDKIDWIKGSTNIILIGSTNHKEKLDSASLSRFDRVIEFTLPSKKQRKDIAEKILYKKSQFDPLFSVADDLDLSIYAGNTEWMSWRDIDNQLNEVHRRAVMHNILISNKLIQDVFMDDMLWRENKWLEQNKEELDIVTYHELWHAFIAHLNGELAHTVTIVPRWKSLWSAWIMENNNMNLKTPENILKSIQKMVAWRMAEKYFKWNITTWASNDYERATKLAFAYFKDYNFEYKWKSLWLILNDNIVWNNQVLQESVINKLEKFVKEMIKDQENIVTKMIQDNESAFHNVLDKLLENKIIYRKDFCEILDK